MQHAACDMQHAMCNMLPRMGTCTSSPAAPTCDGHHAHVGHQQAVALAVKPKPAVQHQREGAVEHCKGQASGGLDQQQASHARLLHHLHK